MGTFTQNRVEISKNRAEFPIEMIKIAKNSAKIANSMEILTLYTDK